MALTQDDVIKVEFVACLNSQAIQRFMLLSATVKGFRTLDLRLERKRYHYNTTVLSITKKPLNFDSWLGQRALEEELLA